MHTDVWVSMGEPKDVWDTRVQALRPYRVDAERSWRPLVGLTRCSCTASRRSMMPGRRFGRQAAERYGLADGLEVSDEVFRSPASVVFEQAHNRMHTIKALMVATLTAETCIAPTPWKWASTTWQGLRRSRG